MKTCKPTEHDYTAFQTTSSSLFGMTSPGSVVLYCRNCGHYTYIQKTPAQYIPSIGAGGTHVFPQTTSVTFQLLNKTL